VAIKVLPAVVAEDEERLARFEREARLLATLNHQNIAGIYEVGEARPPAGAPGPPLHFLVMELAEGEDLAERLERGPVPLEEALGLALQMARALEAAHAKGVIHRDLKPGNVKVSPAGEVKVLDFGLAKALDPTAGVSGSEPSLTFSPTLTANMTQAGVLLGTAAYMSPEQARGRAADKRSDVWAFGVMLYEMLTGGRLFAGAGETASDVLAAVLRADPDWRGLPEETPRAVRRLLRRCLERDPDRRLHDIADARIEIEEAMEAGAEGFAPVDGELATPPRPVWLRALPWVLVSLLAFVAGWLWRSGGGAPGDLPLRKLQVAEVEEVSLFGFGLGAAIAPDGETVAYISEGKLWIRRLQELEPREMPGSNFESMPIWSPDSRWLAYPVGRKLLRAQADGGEPRAVTDLPTNVGDFGGGWTDDDRIVLTTGYSGVLEVSAQGGDLREALSADPETEADFHQASLLPGGRGVLFAIHYKNRPEGPIGLWDGTRRQILVEEDGLSFGSPVYSSTGHILFTREPTSRGVWAVPFSLDSLEVTGEPFIVALGADKPSVARDGTLVLLRGSEEETRELVWIDRSGGVIETAGLPQQGIREIGLVPGAEQVTVAATEGGSAHLWLQDLQQVTKRQITTGQNSVRSPSISADGSRVAYHVAAQEPQIYVADIDSRSPAVHVGPGGRPKWTPDGRGLVYELYGARGLWYVEIGPDGRPGEPRLILDPPADESEPVVSPDGRWLAYSSDASGGFEVYVTTFPSAERNWQVSPDGGSLPHWSPDGGEIFYVDGEGNLMVVGISLGEVPTISAPKRLFDGRPYGLGGGREYAVGAADRILVARAVGGHRSTTKLLLIQNWYAEFGPR
jgi:dipeptidyl aminopeptidase/acylaminoacyl peptidase